MPWIKDKTAAASSNVHGDHNRSQCSYPALIGIKIN